MHALQNYCKIIAYLLQIFRVKTKVKTKVKVRVKVSKALLVKSKT